MALQSRYSPEYIETLLAQLTHKVNHGLHVLTNATGHDDVRLEILDALNRFVMSSLKLEALLLDDEAS